MLIGRGSERERIESLLEDARAGQSAVLVLRGEPGIGKTALLEYAAERAEGMTVTRALGTETESELPFAALHELVLPLLGELEALPERQSDALRGALALGPARDVDRFAVYAATLSLLTQAAEKRPLLCLVDDAQWVDSASADALRFSCRRLGSERIAVLFAAREGDVRAFEAAELPDLRLAGLHRNAAEKLLARSDAGLSEVEAERVLEMSRGNPLALLELPRALRALRDSGEPLQDPIPVGRRVEEAFLARVRLLTPEAQSALLVAAASGSGDVETIVRALNGLRVRQDALEEAERARLLTLRDGTLAFAHPLVRSAVYGSADAAQRRAAHRVLADALRGVENDRYAWHLAASVTGPDEDVAGVLERTADEAGKRGGPGAESLAYERAARLSSDPEARARRLLAAASAASQVGWLARIESLCREALAATSDPVFKGEIHKELENVLYWAGRLDDAHMIKLRVSEELEHVAPIQAAHMRARATASLTHKLDGREAVAVGRSAWEMLRRHGGEDLRVPMMLAHCLVRVGDLDEGRPLALECAAALEHDDVDALRVNASDALLLLDEHESAKRLCAAQESAPREKGAFSSLAWITANAAAIDESRGQLYQAYANAVASVELAEALEEELLQLAYSTAQLASVAASLGRDETRDHAARAIDIARRCGSRLLEAQTRAAVGALELSLARPAQAIEELERVRHTVRGGGWGNPAFVQFSPELIEAYVRAGRAADAAGELVLLDSEVTRSSTPWSLAVAARCRGLLANEDEFEAGFEESLCHHERSLRLIERARTELAYGERLRRAGRPKHAREHLRTALDAFDAAGAAAWEKRARDELRATGETVQNREVNGRDTLTPQELQVALIVAEGATNKEAAARLFLSMKTIEFHLRNAYRKLGIRSRTELANAILRAPDHERDGDASRNSPQS